MSLAPGARLRRARTVTAGLLVVAGLLALGGPAGAAPLPPGAVARVGTTVITSADLEHAMTASAGRAGVPDAPAFRRCAAVAARQLAGPAPAALDLTAACRRRAGQLRRQALTFLVSRARLEAEARRLGVRLTARQRREPARRQLDGLARGIRARALAGVEPVTERQVATYAARHRRALVRPQRRDVELLVAGNRASADAAAAAIAAGLPFGQAVQRFSVDRRTRADDGTHRGVMRGQLPAALDAAVFGARPGTVTGPVGTPYGTYLFRVTRVTPAVRPAPATIAPTIRRYLRNRRQRVALARYVAAYDHRWRQRTACRAGAVVGLCGDLRPARAGARAAAAPASPVTSIEPPVSPVGPPIAPVAAPIAPLVPLTPIEPAPINLLQPLVAPIMPLSPPGPSGLLLPLLATPRGDWDGGRACQWQGGTIPGCVVVESDRRSVDMRRVSWCLDDSSAAPPVSSCANYEDDSVLACPSANPYVWATSGATDGDGFDDWVSDTTIVWGRLEATHQTTAYGPGAAVYSAVTPTSLVSGTYQWAIGCSTDPPPASASMGSGAVGDQPVVEPPLADRMLGTDPDTESLGTWNGGNPCRTNGGTVPGCVIVTEAQGHMFAAGNDANDLALGCPSSSPYVYATVGASLNHGWDDKLGDSDFQTAQIIATSQPSGTHPGGAAMLTSNGGFESHYFKWSIACSSVPPGGAPPPPTCQGTSVTAGAGAYTPVDLPCEGIDLQPGTVLTSPQHGTLFVKDGSGFDALAGTTLPASGVVYYQPLEGYSGSDALTWEGRNGGGTSAPQTVQITVPATPPPTCQGSSVTTPEGQGVTLAFPCQGAGFQSAVVDTGPSHGQLCNPLPNACVPIIGNVIPSSGTARYVPDPGYVGPDVITFQGDGDVDNTQIATISISITSTGPSCQSSSTTASAGTYTSVVFACEGPGLQRDTLVQPLAHGRLFQKMSGGVYVPIVGIFMPVSGIAYYQPDPGSVVGEVIHWQGHSNTGDSPLQTITITPASR